ncbi:MAG: hypothetical protein K8R21_00810 [Leptospira sp.]|nr:hypothetical protein [Leptospira sp.]
MLRIFDSINLPCCIGSILFFISSFAIFAGSHGHSHHSKNHFKFGLPNNFGQTGQQVLPQAIYYNPIYMNQLDYATRQLNNLGNSIPQKTTISIPVVPTASHPLDFSLKTQEMRIIPQSGGENKSGGNTEYLLWKYLQLKEISEIEFTEDKVPEFKPGGRFRLSRTFSIEDTENLEDQIRQKLKSSLNKYIFVQEKKEKSVINGYLINNKNRAVSFVKCSIPENQKSTLCDIESIHSADSDLWKFIELMKTR